MTLRQEPDAAVSRSRIGAYPAMFALTILLGACSYVPDWANPVAIYDNITTDGPEVADAEADASVPGESKEFPDLRSVPERPAETSTAAERRTLAEGLVADRDNARYTDEVLRADTEAAVAGSKPASRMAETPAAQQQLPEVTAPRPAALQDLPAAAPQMPVATDTLAAPRSPTPMISQMAGSGTAAATTATAGAAATAATTAAGTAATTAAAAGSVVPAAPTPPQVAPPVGGRAIAPPPVTAPSMPPAPTTVARAPSAPSYPAAQPQATAPTQAPAVSATGNVLEDVYNSQLAASSAGATTLPPNIAFDPNRATVPGGAQAPASFAFDAGATAGAASGSSDGGSWPGNPEAVIKFGDGSTRLGNGDRARIAVVAEKLGQYAGYVRVVGHASSRTRNMSIEEHMMVNFRMSMARARAVAQVLAEAGVDPARILIEAKGDSEPVYYEAMPSGEAENRRVEIFFD
ncbi:OmpA family protein [Oceanibacterium hippocampi]|nr:OmpA family protein [Oceanibacterium hippocampi]